MTDDQIHSDLDRAERLWTGLKVAFGFSVLVALAAWCATSSAQTLTAPTRSSPYDWACLDASGTVLTTHQRFDTAFVACYNNAQGAEILGGRYRINRPTAPPACPAQPGDESRTQACPSGTTGTWTQARTYTATPPPTCWTAGPWLPLAPSSPESCPAVPAPQPVAPVLGAARVLRTSGTNHDIALSWSAVPGDVGYKVERCAGATCTAFSLLSNRDQGVTSAADTNVSPTTRYSYRVRACADANCSAWLGDYSNVVTPVLSGTPPPTTGSALIRWQHDGKDTAGAAVTIASYRIEYSPVLAGGGTFDLSVDVQAPTTEHTFTGLAAGTWAFRVIAQSAQGLISLPSASAQKVVQ